MANSWDFTADSEIQLSLAQKLEQAADNFDSKVSDMYTQIGNLGSAWVGDDYDSFKTGTEGYKKALADLADSFRMYGNHFTKVSAGTDTLSSELATIIKNLVDGTGAGGGSSDPNGGGTSSSAAGTNPSGGGANNSGGSADPSDGGANGVADPSSDSVSLGDKVGGRYADHWNDFTSDVSDRWADAHGLLSGAGAAALTVVETADMVVDGVIDTALTAVDAVDYGANWLFDLGTGRGGSTTDDYWQNIGQDYAENWDYSNVDNFWEGAGVTIGGVVRTAVDVGQTAVNAVTTAVDWVGGAVSDAVDWVGDAVGTVFDWLF